MYLYENCETNNLVLVIEAPQGFLYPYCTPNKELKSNNNDKINTISNATNKSLKYHSQLSWIKIKQLIPSALHNHSLKSHSITILWSKKMNLYSKSQLLSIKRSMQMLHILMINNHSPQTFSKIILNYKQWTLKNNLYTSHSSQC